MMASKSVGAMPALARAALAAAAPMSELCSSAAEMRRSRMPVWLTIHSSLVSTRFSRSALVRIWAGR